MVPATIHIFHQSLLITLCNQYSLLLVTEVHQWLLVTLVSKGIIPDNLQTGTCLVVSHVKPTNQQQNTDNILNIEHMENIK